MLSRPPRRKCPVVISRGCQNQVGNKVKMNFSRHLLLLEMAAHGFEDIHLQILQIPPLRGDAALAIGGVPGGDIPPAGLIPLNLKGDFAHAM